MVNALVMGGALLQLIGISSYIRSTIKGQTKPNRVTWLMWSIAPMIATAAALSDGVRLAILPVFMAGFGPLLVFIVSFINPQSYWKLCKLDYLCGLFSLLALVLWGITKNPDLAMLFSIISDGLAALPTIFKAWHHPETENATPFLTSIVSQASSSLVIRNWTFMEYGFPVYLIVINLCIIGIIHRTKNRVIKPSGL